MAGKKEITIRKYSEILSEEKNKLSALKKLIKSINYQNSMSVISLLSKNVILLPDTCKIIDLKAKLVLY